MEFWVQFWKQDQDSKYRTSSTGIPSTRPSFSWLVARVVQVSFQMLFRLSSRRPASIRPACYIERSRQFSRWRLAGKCVCSSEFARHAVSRNLCASCRTSGKWLVGHILFVSRVWTWRSPLHLSFACFELSVLCVLRIKFQQFNLLYVKFQVFPMWFCSVSRHENSMQFDVVIRGSKVCFSKIFPDHPRILKIIFEAIDSIRVAHIDLWVQNVDGDPHPTDRSFDEACEIMCCKLEVLRLEVLERCLWVKWIGPSMQIQVMEIFRSLDEGIESASQNLCYKLEISGNFVVG